MSAASPATETRHLRIRGRVQGVGYRASCMDIALQLGVTGWVRNRSDGSVEALLQGPPDKVAAMCRWLREDVPGARVDELDETPVAAPERLARFELLRTV